MFTILCTFSLILAALPALLFLRNLTQYRPLRGEPAAGASISVLIPARNEERCIGAAVAAVLANERVDLEVIVLDDHSEDGTARLVDEIARRDPRVRLVPAPDLPEGWCGKQHACYTLAALASKPFLVFLDADVQLASDALTRMARFLEQSGADLVSGFPRQKTVGLLEQMVIPLIHFLLLGFLPLHRMRAGNRPATSAGCGQLFLAKKSSYELMGGHSAIRGSLHDGLKLPRAYRAAGLRTDVFDATDAAECRMYRSDSDLCSGLAKNATEALAAPALILPATVVLLGGQVLPLCLLLDSLIGARSSLQTGLAASATAFAYLPRIAGVWRFRQSPIGAVLHPFGVLILLAIQWYAFARNALGKPATWKGRAYPARTG